MYYLYRHIRLDKNEPFYIGISRKYKGKSPFARAYLKAGRNKIWRSIIKRTEYNIEILLESEDINFIKSKEREFISLYGKIIDDSGTLANISDGGEWETYIMTDEIKSKISRTVKEKMKDPDIIKKIRDTHSIPVIETDKEGNSKRWDSIIEAANFYNIDRGSITKVCKGERKSCLKLKWNYAE